MSCPTPPPASPATPDPSIPTPPPAAPPAPAGDPKLGRLVTLLLKARGRLRLDELVIALTNIENPFSGDLSEEEEARVTAVVDQCTEMVDSGEIASDAARLGSGLHVLLRHNELRLAGDPDQAAEAPRQDGPEPDARARWRARLTLLLFDTECTVEEAVAHLTRIPEPFGSSDPSHPHELTDEAEAGVKAALALIEEMVSAGALVRTYSAGDETWEGLIRLPDAPTRQQASPADELDDAIKEAEACVEELSERIRQQGTCGDEVADLGKAEQELEALRFREELRAGRATSGPAPEPPAPPPPRTPWDHLDARAMLRVAIAALETYLLVRVFPSAFAMAAVGALTRLVALFGRASEGARAAVLSEVRGRAEAFGEGEAATMVRDFLEAVQWQGSEAPGAAELRAHRIALQLVKELAGFRRSDVGEPVPPAGEGKASNPRPPHQRSEELEKAVAAVARFLRTREGYSSWVGARAQFALTQLVLYVALLPSPEERFAAVGRLRHWAYLQKPREAGLLVEDFLAAVFYWRGRQEALAEEPQESPIVARERAEAIARLMLRTVVRARSRLTAIVDAGAERERCACGGSGAVLCAGCSGGGCGACAGQGELPCSGCYLGERERSDRPDPGPGARTMAERARQHVEGLGDGELADRQAHLQRVEQSTVAALPHLSSAAGALLCPHGGSSGPEGALGLLLGATDRLQRAVALTRAHRRIVDDEILNRQVEADVAGGVR